MNEKRLLTLLAVIFFIIFLALFILLLRILLPSQLDDVHPDIACEESLMLASDSLMIIPLYRNNSIAENQEWCKYILSLNKTLAMHGVYHSYMEFGQLIGEEEIRLGMNEFKKCFGFYPEIFEAPQLELNKENEGLLRNMGFKIRKSFFNMFHKVYHCSDTGLASNKIIDYV